MTTPHGDTTMAWVQYEWDRETVLAYHAHVAEGVVDVIDHDHAEKLADLKPYPVEPDNEGVRRHDLVLVRDDANGRSWAYVEADGTLPDDFADAYGCPVAKVPQRFHRELSRNRDLALDIMASLAPGAMRPIILRGHSGRNGDVRALLDPAFASA